MVTEAVPQQQATSLAAVAATAAGPPRPAGKQQCQPAGGGGTNNNSNAAAVAGGTLDAGEFLCAICYELLLDPVVGGWRGGTRAETGKGRGSMPREASWGWSDIDSKGSCSGTQLGEGRAACWAGGIGPSTAARRTQPAAALPRRAHWGVWGPSTDTHYPWGGGGGEVGSSVPVPAPPPPGSAHTAAAPCPWLVCAARGQQRGAPAPFASTRQQSRHPVHDCDHTLPKSPLLLPPRRPVRPRLLQALHRRVARLQAAHGLPRRPLPHLQGGAAALRHPALR